MLEREKKSGFEELRLIRIAEIIHPTLLEKIESSGILTGYDHSMEFIHASTRLQIADIAHSRQDFYEGIITMDNVDDILSRLPAALSDFENFEFHFPEFASCWDSTR